MHTNLSFEALQKKYTDEHYDFDEVGTRRNDFIYRAGPETIAVVKECVKTDRWETARMKYGGKNLTLYCHAIVHDRKEKVTAVMFVFILTE